MKSKLFYGLVGLAAFFIVFQHLQAIGYSVWEWWDDRNYVSTPVYSSVVASDAVERPVQKIRPDIGSVRVAPIIAKTGSKTDRRYLVIPTHLQYAKGSISSDALDEIIVTARKRNGLPEGLRLPKPSDRAADKNGKVINKTRHKVQRSCQGSTYTNLLLHDRITKKTKPIFDAPLSLVGHQLISNGKQTSHILAFTVILDTNQDDRLTCQDFIHMAIFDINADTLHWVDMGYAEPLTPDYSNNLTKETLLRPINDTEYVMGIGIDENKDGLFDPKTEIIEMAVLNIAEKSFEKIVTAADLAKVQDILYSTADE